MPNSPLRKCSHPGCFTLVRDTSRCPKHLSNKGTSKNRPGDPFYNSKAWIRVRDERRALDPLCVLCLEQDIVTAMWAVDHIEPRCDRPDLELEISNTRSLCEKHHNSRTARDRRR